MTMQNAPTPSRRTLIASGASGFALIALAPRHALATNAGPANIADAIKEFVGDAQVKPGKVKLDIAPLVENGNSVSMTVSVESPMTAADHVAVIAVFNEKNPQPNVANFHLSPRSGRAEVSARIRLATSQTITAIAKMNDGSFWSTTADVLVTIAACTEE